jgi:hypothetical protein
LLAACLFEGGPAFRALGEAGFHGCHFLGIEEAVDVIEQQFLTGF